MKDGRKEERRKGGKKEGRREGVKVIEPAERYTASPIIGNSNKLKFYSNLSE